MHWKFLTPGAAIQLNAFCCVLLHLLGENSTLPDLSEGNPAPSRVDCQIDNNISSQQRVFWFDIKYNTFRVRLFFKPNVGNDGCLKLKAENQNNFDNSNNSLVCFKAPDTFPRSVTFL